MKRFQFINWRHLKIVRRQSTLLKKTKFYDPVLWMGFNCLKASATSRRQFTFSHQVPRNSWYSLYRRREDERLSWTWSHPVVLNTGPMDWEYSTLTTRLFLHKAGFHKGAYIIAHIRGLYLMWYLINLKITFRKSSASPEKMQSPFKNLKSVCPPSF